MECVEREGEGRGLALIEGSNSKQSEMNVQCEQIISAPPPFTTHTQPTHACKHSFVTRARCVWSWIISIQRGSY